MASSRVVIIGAGLSGLIAARRLVDSERVGPGDLVIVEELAEVGGRLATARIGDAVLDHGAQFFTVRSDEFRADVDSWLQNGVVEEWSRGFAEVDGYPRYRVAGGMHRLAVRLADELTSAGVEITTGAAVESIETIDGRWCVKLGTSSKTDGTANGTTDGEAESQQAEFVVATPPVPSTLDLLAGGLAALEPAAAAAMDGFACHRVIALLTLLDASPELPSPGALQQPDDPTFSFIADNQAKGISSAPAVTFHTAHRRSAELWDATDDEVLAALLPAAAVVVKPAAITETEIVRWPHSGPVRPYPEPCLVAAPGLILAGDGFGPSKVEGAYLSGRAAADAIVAGLSDP